MKTLYTFLALSLVLSFQLCQAQEYHDANAFSLEAFGVSGTASINYERNFLRDSRRRFATARIGLGLNHFTHSLTIPHGFTINFQARKSFIETGMLVAFTFDNAGNQPPLYYLAPCLGVRTIVSRSRLFVRAYATVIIPLDSSLEIIPYFGLGLGRTFR